MPFAAITYKVKPGHEDEIAAIFADFQRADSPILHDDDGDEVGIILATGLFIKDDTMVRVIQYEGHLSDVARHMAGQAGVHTAEERLAPYLAEARDTSTVEGFLHYFENSTMRSIQQLSVPAELMADIPIERYRQSAAGRA
ncbi:SchA/CurD [Micromonospora rosaria]|uniref:SchA/CurD n=1 Tax=Micromonospora rosaria TaxID=47874 RepID=A0A136PZF6_9ACTN|nr:SchA/CurD-like domain-containing protein [Micromonospora rosaria]KXK63830.1 SchA/CurD [Micromonospora rosaria]